MSPESSHLSDGDLLLWIDRELTSARAAEIREHLDACSLCRSRAADLEKSIADFVRLYHSDPLLPADGARALLRTRLARRASRPGTRIQQLAFAAAVTLCLLLAGIAIGTRANLARTDIAAIPNVRLTPGATSPVTAQEICSGNLPTNDPAVPDPLKQAVLKEYGLKDVSNSSYQIDFLVTPQLGGAVNIRNLWPEPARKTVWNARVKDQLEDRLHSLVCSGKLDLSTAQRELSEDWVAAYRKYFGIKEPRAVSLFTPRYFDGTNKILCSVASSTAFLEYGSG